MKIKVINISESKVIRQIKNIMMQIKLSRTEKISICIRNHFNPVQNQSDLREKAFI